MARAQRKAREHDVDMASAGKRTMRGPEDAMVARRGGAFERGRGPGPKHGKRHR